MKITKNLHIGMFWIDVCKDGRWIWRGRDVKRDLSMELGELWHRFRPLKRHPSLELCPSFGRYYTSGGNNPLVGCSIRYGKKCRINEEAEKKCKRIVHLSLKDRKKVLGQ